MRPTCRPSPRVVPGGACLHLRRAAALMLCAGACSAWMQRVNKETGPVQLPRDDRDRPRTGHPDYDRFLERCDATIATARQTARRLDAMLGPAAGAVGAPSPTPGAIVDGVRALMTGVLGETAHVRLEVKGAIDADGQGRRLLRILDGEEPAPRRPEEVAANLFFRGKFDPSEPQLRALRGLRDSFGELLSLQYATGEAASSLRRGIERGGALFRGASGAFAGKAPGYDAAAQEAIAAKVRTMKVSLRRLRSIADTTIRLQRGFHEELNR